MSQPLTSDPVGEPVPPLSKKSLRAMMRELLLSTERDDASGVREAVGRWIVEHPEVRVIAAFAALPGEPDLLPLVGEFADRTWVFPLVVGEHLSFHTVKVPSSELARGSFGIREPSPSLPEVSPSMIDGFLCPGIAFTRTGDRLGRGRGFYDRVLASARAEAAKVGVCFPFQVVEDTCSEPHDVRMDEVITGESGAS